jgi:hypothetical protein
MTTTTTHTDSQLTIRQSTPADEAALTRLAQLDSARPVSARHVLIAEEGGEVVAARPLGGGEAIANPFRHTAAIVAVLEARAAELEAASQPVEPRRLPRALRLAYAARAWYAARA